MISVDLSTWLWAAPAPALHARGASPEATSGAGRQPRQARFYQGIRKLSGCIVTVSDAAGQRPLDPRFDLYCHSPTGFEWGYGGSGPSQLALALLADALSDDGRAFSLYRQFKDAYVRNLHGAGFRISAEEVRAIADQVEAAGARSA